MSDRRAFREQQYDTAGQLVSTGSANAYVVRGARSVTGYSAGLFLTFFPNFTNTGASTLTYGNLAAKSIKKTGTPSALVAGDIVSGTAAQVLFDATNDCFQLLNPQTSTSVDSDKLGGLSLSSSGDRWGVVPFVHTDGVMEIGRYIDFHNSDADTSDNAVRLDTGGSATDLFLTPASAAAKRIVALINSTLASGDVIYFDGTNFVRLAKGSNGDLLTLASGLPSWAAPSSTGGIATIASNSFAAANSQVIATNIPATYAYLVLQISGLSSNTNTRHPRVQVSTDNGSTYDTTAGNYLDFNEAGTALSDASVADFIDQISGATFTSTTRISAYQGGPNMMFHSFCRDNIGPDLHIADGIYIGSTSAINAIRMIWSGTGNSDAGTYALYGVS